MNKKILVLDIDGTLTNSKKDISEKTREALVKIQEMGHIVTLASGRPTPGMIRYAKELEFERFGGYLLSYNGARVINFKTGEVAYQQLLPSHVIKELYDFAEENDCGVITYAEDMIISGRRIDEWIEIESRINGIPVKEVDNFVEYSSYDLNKCLMTADGETAAVLEKKLQEKLGEELSIYRSEPFFLEIMPQNVDKAASLAVFLETLGMTKDDAICCGDGFNDMTMIKFAGTGVAMANAQPVVKEAADYITKSNDEDGLVDVIEKFILA